MTLQTLRSWSSRPAPSRNTGAPSRRRALLTGAFAAAVLFSTATPESAAAATNPVGLHEPTWVQCNGGYQGVALTAGAPRIEASIVDYSRGNVVNGGGANHVQLVGFRQSLVVWNEATRAWHFSDQNLDGKRDSGPLYQAYVGNQFSYLMPTEWYNTSARRWETGATPFAIRYKGYYRVWTEYFWYADALAPGGSDALYSVQHTTVTGSYGYQTTGWCTY